MTDYLNCIEQNPKADPQGSVIWLHGLGASADDFANVVPELGLPPDLALRFIFPNAPQMPVTINQGYIMPAWYDITGFDLSSREDEDGLVRSEQQIQALIQREIDRGIPADKIIVAGFSQGGATALFTGLRYPKTLNGILVLSGYCPLRLVLGKTKHEANQNTHIMVGHGMHDDVVPVVWANTTVNQLRAWHYSVSFQEYMMAHSVCAPELVDIGRWIAARYV